MNKTYDAGVRIDGERIFGVRGERERGREGKRCGERERNIVIYPVYNT